MSGKVLSRIYGFGWGSQFRARARKQRDGDFRALLCSAVCSVLALIEFFYDFLQAALYQRSDLVEPLRRHRFKAQDQNGLGI